MTVPPPESHPPDADADQSFDPDVVGLRVGRSLGRTLYLRDVLGGVGKVIGIVDRAELAATIVAAFEGRSVDHSTGLLQAQGRILVDDGLECGFLDTEEIALAIADRVNQVNGKTTR